jgi:arabinogalactan endo-1,4-beta-galactosidase
MNSFTYFNIHDVVRDVQINVRFIQPLQLHFSGLVWKLYQDFSQGTILHNYAWIIFVKELSGWFVLLVGYKLKRAQRAVFGSSYIKIGLIFDQVTRSYYSFWLSDLYDLQGVFYTILSLYLPEMMQQGSWDWFYDCI